MLKTKPFRQSAGFCGPASMKIVLDYFGIQKSEKELAVLAKSTKEKGTSAQQIVAAAKKLGFKSFYKDNSDVSEIKKYIDKKVPVIVDWFSGDDGHYSVAVEVDNKFIYLQDPELGRVRKMDLQTFKRVWFDFEDDFLKKKADLILRRIIVIEK